MSQVKVGKQRLAIAGETTSVSKVNTLFTDITSASTAIGESNTRTESISRRHLKDLYETPQGVHPTFHQLQYLENSAAQADYSSITYQLVSHGGGAQITFPSQIVLKPGEAVRFQATMNIINATPGTDDPPAYALQRDQYYFKFYANVDGLNTNISPDYGYSLCCNTNTTMPGGYSNWITKFNVSFSDPVDGLIIKQKVMFSYIYFNKTALDQTITTAEVRVRVQAPLVGCTQNTIRIKEWTFMAMGAR